MISKNGVQIRFYIVFYSSFLAPPEDPNRQFFRFSFAHFFIHRIFHHVKNHRLVLSFVYLLIQFELLSRDPRGTIVIMYRKRTKG